MQFVPGRSTFIARFPFKYLTSYQLEQLREGQWDAVAASLPPYLAAVQQMMSAYQRTPVAAEKQAMAEQLQAIQFSQGEIVERLRVRMHQLEQNMVKLQQSKNGCRDYAAQTPRRIG
ncbi:flagellar protein FliT [Pantoea sp. Eser]|nr:flagellar protein FliT [Pantoea sp. Eser]